MFKSRHSAKHKSPKVQTHSPTVVPRKPKLILTLSIIPIASHSSSKVVRSWRPSRADLHLWNFLSSDRVFSSSCAPANNGWRSQVPSPSPRPKGISTSLSLSLYLSLSLLSLSSPPPPLPLFPLQYILLRSLPHYILTKKKKLMYICHMHSPIA